MIQIKQTSNVITIVRISLSITLLFVKPLSNLFFSIYFVCGISDILDGYIARKLNIENKLGATLDSIADFIFIGCSLTVFLSILNMPLWIMYLIITIVIIRFASLLVGFYKYHALAFLHTYSNKITGLVLFCFPILYRVFGIQITAGIIGSIAVISAIEELVINISSKSLLRDVTSVFSKQK